MNNMNDFAKIVTEQEGGKVNLSIAQVKEVLRIVCDLCVTHPYFIALIIKNGLKRKK